MSTRGFSDMETRAVRRIASYLTRTLHVAEGQAWQSAVGLVELVIRENAKILCCHGEQNEQCAQHYGGYENALSSAPPAETEGK